MKSTKMRVDPDMKEIIDAIKKNFSSINGIKISDPQATKLLAKKIKFKKEIFEL